MSAAKVDNLHDAPVAHDDVVELEVAVCKPHAVQIGDAVQNLEEAASYLLSRHAARHDNSEQIIGRILHNFEPAALFL